MKKFKLQAAIAAISLATAMSASASLTVSYVNTHPGGTVNLTVTGNAGYASLNFSGEVYAGVYNLTVNGLATPSFCIDVQRDSGTASDYYYNDLASSPLSLAGPMGAAAAADVEKLWAAYYSPTMSDLNAAALQLAIWETVATGDGNYTVSATDRNISGVVAETAIMLGNLDNLTTQADLVGLVSPTTQNYVVAVPEASTVLAGMLLLLPLGASSLRILRRGRIA